jgi:hypothetical protein
MPSKESNPRAANTPLPFSGPLLVFFFTPNSLLLEISSKHNGKCYPFGLGYASALTRRVFRKLSIEATSGSWRKKPLVANPHTNYQTGIIIDPFVF